MKRNIAVLVLMIPVLAAVMTCTPKEDSVPEGVVVITAVLNLNPEIVLENNPLLQLIEEELGIRLRIEAPPQSGYSERVRMLVSTGNMPDLIHYGADIFATQWAEEGLILDVTDLIAAAIALKSVVISVRVPVTPIDETR